MCVPISIFLLKALNKEKNNSIYLGHVNHAQKEINGQSLILRVFKPSVNFTNLGSLWENKIKIQNFHNRLEHWTKTNKIKLHRFK